MKKVWLARAAVVLILSCRGDDLRPVEPVPDAGPPCGNGAIDPGETCDGANLAGKTCQGEGFDTGTLTCTAACTLDVGGCTRRCGNGVLDVGEACDGALGVPRCDTFGYVACEGCTLSFAHCVSQAYEAAPPTELTKGGPAIIADVSPATPGGDLVVAVPSFNRVEVFPWTLVLGFDPAGSRKVTVGRPVEAVAAADLDGDGDGDILVASPPGVFDVLRAEGGLFEVLPVDAGCPGARLVERPLGPDGGAAVVAWGCDALFTAGVAPWVVPAPQIRAAAVALDRRTVAWLDGAGVLSSALPAPGVLGTLPLEVSAVDLADVDGDGDLDVLGLGPGSVLVLEAADAGFTERARFTAPGVTAARFLDADLDGEVDALLDASAGVTVQRGRGQFRFTAVEVPMVPAGMPLSLSAGDADGDGDLDLAWTLRVGADGSRTQVARNRVR